MTYPNYIKALTRSDLSQWLVHFVRPHNFTPPATLEYAGDILRSIFKEVQIRGSRQEFVTRYCAEGAVCFYDAPPAVWPEIAQTNPNGRPAVGVICHKNSIWSLGGRPVIYTDVSQPTYWPESERFRIVHTDLSRAPQPVDWMHEREWRVPGNLSLNQPQIPHIWWWPIVPDRNWMTHMFEMFPTIVDIWVISEYRVINRNAT
jgi:hypothetical protein